MNIIQVTTPITSSGTNEATPAPRKLTATVIIISGKIDMMARPATSLDPDDPNATSWLSTRVPDALFAACLMESEHYTQADDRYGDYKTKYYEELLPAARFELRELRRNGDYSPFEPAARSK